SEAGAQQLCPAVTLVGDLQSVGTSCATPAPPALCVAARSCNQSWEVPQGVVSVTCPNFRSLALNPAGKDECRCKISWIILGWQLPVPHHRNVLLSLVCAATSPQPCSHLRVSLQSQSCYPPAGLEGKDTIPAFRN
uniref:Uncharacterized protein n=1 Tax=Zonotrichia albicollis TaxID=44394 RepID=A0A8D2MSC6_ZONAL